MPPPRPPRREASGRSGCAASPTPTPCPMRSSISAASSASRKSSAGKQRERPGPAARPDRSGAARAPLGAVALGPRTIVGSSSVVAATLPPDTVCAGNPAKVICSLEDYLAKHRARIAQGPTFAYRDYDERSITPERRAEMVAALATKDGYIIGGRTAELDGRGGTPRTPRA